MNNNIAKIYQNPLCLIIALMPIISYSAALASTTTLLASALTCRLELPEATIIVSIMPVRSRTSMVVISVALPLRGR